MHVVHLYDGHEQVYDGKGSVPTVVWQFARETADRGHRVDVVERRWADLPPTAVHDGVRFHRMDMPTGADEPWSRVPYEQVGSPTGLARIVGDRTVFAGTALQRLRRLDPDVIHVHLPFTANVLVTLAPSLRDCMVYTAHLGELRLDLLSGDADGDVPGLLSVFSPDVYLAKRAARTTVLNPDIERAFADRGVPDRRLEVVPNGVDVDRFGGVDDDDRRRVREAYDLDPDRPTLLFVGTVMPRKGVTDLLRAVAGLEETPQVVVAGDTDLDPEYVDEVETLMWDNGLSAEVTLAGFVPEEDLPGLYAVADVFVLPSHEEGFGMTAVEALAAGTPVVGTRVGALPSVVDEDTGTLVEPGSSAALRAAIAEYVHSGECDATACRARGAEYSWGSVAERLVRIYDDVGRGSERPVPGRYGAPRPVRPDGVASGRQEGTVDPEIGIDSNSPQR